MLWMNFTISIFSKNFVCYETGRYTFVLMTLKAEELILHEKATLGRTPYKAIYPKLDE